MPPKPPPTARRPRRGDELPHAEVALRAYESLQTLHCRLRRIRDAALHEFGVTHAQLRVLNVAATAPGSSLSDIARTLDLTRQAVHRVAHLLERCGFLTLSRGRGRGRPLRAYVGERTGVAAHAAQQWEFAWLGVDVGYTQHRDTLDAMWGISRWLRKRLPWRVRDVQDLAYYPLSSPRPPRPQEGFDADGYAALEAAFPSLRWEHP
jgi:DNA-binding MarR family transcriptional regulator